MSNEVVKVLEAAKALIGTPEKWCKGAQARTVDGAPTFATDDKASRWCAMGALQVKMRWQGKHWAALMAAAAERGADYISGFNDSASTTHSDVMQLFDRAIELAKQEKA